MVATIQEDRGVRAKPRIGLIEFVTRSMEKRGKKRRKRRKGKPGHSLFYRNGNGRGRVNVKKNSNKRKIASTRWLR